MTEVVAEMTAGSGQGSDQNDAGGVERRMVLRLLHYWRGKSNDAGQAVLASIAPQEIPDIWPNCFVIALNRPSYEASFIEFGANLSDVCGGDYRGKPVKSIPPDTIVGKTAAFLPEVLAKSVPVSRGGSFVRADGHGILYRGILLPLSDAKGVIDHILGAANFRDIAQS